MQPNARERKNSADVVVDADSARRRLLRYFAPLAKEKQHDGP